MSYVAVLFAEGEGKISTIRQSRIRLWRANRRLRERKAMVEFEGAWKILFDFNSFLNSGGGKSGYEKAPEGGDSVLYPIWLPLLTDLRTFFKENPLVD
jgi:hypothetical protein